MCIFFLGGGRIFIQIATAQKRLQYLMDSIEIRNRKLGTGCLILK